MKEKTEMRAREASDYSRAADRFGKGLSISYLVRAANKQLIKGARKIEDGPVPYWVFDKAGLDEYLNSERKPGRKPKAGEAP